MHPLQHQETYPFEDRAFISAAEVSVFDLVYFFDRRVRANGSSSNPPSSVVSPPGTKRLT